MCMYVCVGGCVKGEKSVIVKKFKIKIRSQYTIKEESN